MAPRSFSSVVVYCGAQPSVPARYLDQAYQFGQVLARRSIRLVFGAGSLGMMGAVARGVLDGGSTILGIIPDFLVDKETAGAPLGPQIVVSSMHERKTVMLEHADAVVALPGGFGTMDELMEAIAWNQLGRIRKPVGILDINGYYAGLIAWLDNAVREGFVRECMRTQMLVDTDGDRLLQRMAQAELPPPLI